MAKPGTGKKNRNRKKKSLWAASTLVEKAEPA
jgi:hypothetical protein